MLYADVAQRSGDAFFLSPGPLVRFSRPPRALAGGMTPEVEAELRVFEVDLADQYSD